MSERGRPLGSGRLMKRKRGGSAHLWVLDYRDGQGIRRRQALSFDRRIAERMRSEIIRARDLERAGLATEEGQSRLISEVRDLYLQDLEPRVSENHFRNVATRTERVMNAVGVKRIRDLRSTQILQMRAARVQAGVGHQSINHEVANFRAMLLWAAKHGVIAMCPIPQIDRLPMDRGHVRRQRRAMTEDEVRRFLRAAEEDDRAVEDRIAAVRTIGNGTKSKAWNARDRRTRVPQAPLWCFFVEGGGRYFEVVSTQWADFDIERRLITLRAEVTKNGKARVVPVRQELADALLALRPIHERVLWREIEPTDKLFLTPEGCHWDPISKNCLRIFGRLLERAGIRRCDERGHVLDLHALRHTAASRWARAGVPITTSQRLLGHSTIELTSRYYTHVEVEDLRNAVEMVAQPLRVTQWKQNRSDAG